jgi:hypothetical protein
MQRADWTRLLSSQRGPARMAVGNWLALAAAEPLVHADTTAARCLHPQFWSCLSAKRVYKPSLMCKMTSAQVQRFQAWRAVLRVVCPEQRGGARPRVEHASRERGTC